MTTQIAFSPADAAKRVGLSESTLKRAIHSGHLRAKKQGRRYLITDEQLRKWLDGMEDA